MFPPCVSITCPEDTVPGLITHKSPKFRGLVGSLKAAIEYYNRYLTPMLLISPCKILNYIILLLTLQLVSLLVLNPSNEDE